MSELSGTVTDGTTTVQGAKVHVVDTAGSTDPSQWTIVGGDTSDANGDWSVTGLDGGEERYHAVVQYDDGSQLFNADSLPYLTVPWELQAPTVGLQVNALEPASVGSAIPDSGGDHQWNTDEGSGSTLADNIGGLDGTINGPTWQTGAGTGDVYLSYDGNDDLVDLGSASRTAMTHWTENGTGTALFWVNPNNFNNNQHIFGGTVGADAVGFGYRINDDQTVSVRIGDGSGTTMAAIDTTATLATGWSPIAITADGSTLRLFYGDPLSEIGSDSISGGTTNDFTQNVAIGRNTDSGINSFNGGIDIGFVDSVGQSQSELQSFVDNTSQFYA